MPREEGRGGRREEGRKKMKENHQYSIAFLQICPWCNYFEKDVFSFEQHIQHCTGQPDKYFCPQCCGTETTLTSMLTQHAQCQVKIISFKH
jgi:hypothetical protein